MFRGMDLEQKQAWMRERYSAPARASVPAFASQRFTERHYTVLEIAKMWSVTVDVIRNLFAREPGVMVIGDLGSRIKRRYTTLRVPESVLERVHRRLCNPDLTKVHAPR